MRSITINPDGTWIIYEGEHTLSYYQTMVGGYIEALTGPDWCAFINEEGKLQDLDENPVAELWMRTHGLPLYGWDYLVGPAVFVGLPDAEGETTELSAALWDDLEAFLIAGISTDE
jgi:hypothetical protein